MTRPWVVHTLWFVAFCAICTASFYLGASTMRWGVSPLVWQDMRKAEFAEISLALAELEGNDITLSENLAIARLRDALVDLASQDDGWLCADYQSKGLAKALSWFDAHPDHHATQELRPFIAEGLRACEKRTRTK